MRRPIRIYVAPRATPVFVPNARDRLCAGPLRPASDVAKKEQPRNINEFPSTMKPPIRRRRSLGR